MPTEATLLCVGSELLRGKLNTHASTISRQLAPLGIRLAAERTVLDALEPLTQAIREARRATPIVIVTGGLGPTFDDLTREAAAAACRRPLKQSQPLLRGLYTKFRRARYRKMPPANARQADLIEGAIAIPNAHGTAPGQWLLTTSAEGRVLSAEHQRLRRDSGLRTQHSALLVLLPGPPREMTPMLEGWVIPRLKRLYPPAPSAEAHLHFVGIPESVADGKIRPVIARWGDAADFTILAHLGLVDLDLFVTASTRIRARAVVRQIVRQVLGKLGPFCYGVDRAYPLENVVGDLLRRRRATVALAESCTGGLVAARLTDSPGSSDYVLGGVVSYSNASKVRELGVPAALLARHGAVSRETVRAMAEGVRRRFGSTFGVAVTGIAGPGGGTRSRPVGLVWIALAGPRGVQAEAFRFSGSRDAVRQRTVVMVLDRLRRAALAE